MSALSCAGLAYQPVQAQWPPEGITFKGGELTNSSWNISTEAGTATVTEDVTLSNFSIVSSADPQNPEGEISSVLNIFNGNTLFLNGFSSSDMGYDGEGNHHLTVNASGDGYGLLKMVLNFEDYTSSGGEQEGSAISLLSYPHSEQMLTVPPATMTVNGVSLELVADIGIRVGNGASFTLDNYDNPVGHVYIGVKKEGDKFITAGPYMYGGIEVINGASTVSIHTHDLKIYSNGLDGDFPTLLATSWETSETSESNLQEFGKRGPRKISIEADKVDFQAFGGNSYFAVAIYAQQRQKKEDYANAEIYLKGGNFTLETNWNGGLAAVAVVGTEDFEPSKFKSVVDLDFDDDIFIGITNQAITADGYAEVSLSANNISIVDTAQNDFTEGFINTSYTGVAEFTAQSYIGVTTEDPYLMTAYSNSRIQMDSQQLMELTGNGTVTYAEDYSTVLLNAQYMKSIAGDITVEATTNAVVKVSAQEMVATSGSIIVQADSNASVQMSGGQMLLTADDFTVQAETNASVIVNAQNLSSTASNIVVQAETEASVQMCGQQLMVLTAESYLAQADTNALVQMNYDASQQAPLAGTTSQLTGHIQANGKATVNVGLASADSWLKGGTSDNRFSPNEDDTETEPGTISIHGANNSTWYVKLFQDEKGTLSYSNLSEYYSHGPSNVDLTTETNGQNLQIVNLLGSGANFRLRSVVDTERKDGADRDHVLIRSGTGAHTIFVDTMGAIWKDPVQADYLVWHDEMNGATSQRLDKPDESPNPGALSFTLSNPGGEIESGIYVYELMTRDAIDGPGTEWFLQRKGNPDNPNNPDDPNDPGFDPEYSPPADLDRTLAGFGAEYAIWWAELSDLRKRLGEVRYGAQDGAWVRAIAQKDDIAGVGSGRFTQKTYALNVGVDHIVIQDEDRMWLLGGNLKYANANQRIKHSRYGKGDIHDWGMNLYATYANQYGCYSDLVFTLDHYSKKITTRMLDNNPVGGRWHNYGIGVSLEIGKMFSSTQNDEGWGPWYNQWWIEPQAQLAYYRIKGKSFTLSNGLMAKQGNVEFFTGRLGLVAGKKFNYGKDRAEVDKRYSQFYIKGGIKHEFLGNQRLTVNDSVNEVKFKGSLRGTRVYYGAGFDWNFSDQLRLYAQVERENGKKYKKDYEISVGLKWQF